eukprot:SAG31_NODE_18588_length_630_cov_1.167608_1_plen_84_part_10
MVCGERRHQLTVYARLAVAIAICRREPSPWTFLVAWGVKAATLAHVEQGNRAIWSQAHPRCRFTPAVGVVLVAAMQKRRRDTSW